MLGERERLSIKFVDEECCKDCGFLRRGEGMITTASIIMRGDLGIRGGLGSVESDTTMTESLSLLERDLRGLALDGRRVLDLTWGGVGTIWTESLDTEICDLYEDPEDKEMTS